MLIRLSLIIAIIAGLASATLSFLKVKEKMIMVMNERDQEKKDKEIAQRDLASTKTTLKKTSESLVTTSNQLVTTTAGLKRATDQNTQLEAANKGLAANLERTTGERNDAQQKLNQWAILDLSPDQVKSVLAELKNTKTQRDTFVAENKIILKDNNRLRVELDRYRGSNDVVVLPAGLKGKVVAVDPKYDFVVLDIGGNQGVLERGEMIVNRNGIMIAKVRIASVEANRSVANVIPSFRREEPMEGDQVLY
jgi:hypothetical protein